MGFLDVITQNMGRVWNDITGVSASNAFNASEAQKQRDWEEYMSNTSYQRGVKDMQAAGINPAIMAMGGSSASTPSSSSASASGNSSSFIAGLVNSAMKIALHALDLKEDNGPHFGFRDD